MPVKLEQVWQYNQVFELSAQHRYCRKQWTYYAFSTGSHGVHHFNLTDFEEAFNTILRKAQRLPFLSRNPRRYCYYLQVITNLKRNAIPHVPGPVWHRYRHGNTFEFMNQAKHSVEHPTRNIENTSELSAPSPDAFILDIMSTPRNGQQRYSLREGGLRRLSETDNSYYLGMRIFTTETGYCAFQDLFVRWQVVQMRRKPNCNSLLFVHPLFRLIN